MSPIPGWSRAARATAIIQSLIVGFGLAPVPECHARTTTSDSTIASTEPPEWVMLRTHAGEDTQPWDGAGAAVAAQGRHALIGVPGDDTLGSGAGRAFLVDLGSGDEVLNLFAPDGDGGDTFGTSVAITSTHLVVGAPGDDDRGPQSGSIYVFSRDTGDFIRKIVPEHVGSGDWFGSSLDADGDLIIAGAALDDDKGPDAGAAYLFRLSDASFVIKLVADDASGSDHFGFAVSVTSHIAAVGAPRDDDQSLNSGSVYTFSPSDGVQRGKILPSDGWPNGRFGHSVSIDGVLAVVGAPGDAGSGIAAGAAYTFDAATGFFRGRLEAPFGNSGDRFGSSVAVEGGLAAVGAPGDDSLSLNAGLAHVFDGLAATHLETLHPETWNDDAAIGASIAFVPRRVLVGAPGDGGLGELSGAAHLFAGTRPCPADLVGADDRVDVLDLLALFAHWGECHDCDEDLNLDFSVDASDLLTLLASWGPCPG